MAIIVIQPQNQPSRYMLEIMYGGVGTDMCWQNWSLMSDRVDNEDRQRLNNQLITYARTSCFFISQSTTG